MACEGKRLGARQIPQVRLFTARRKMNRQSKRLRIVAVERHDEPVGVAIRLGLDRLGVLRTDETDLEEVGAAVRRGLC